MSKRPLLMFQDDDKGNPGDGPEFEFGVGLWSFEMIAADDLFFQGTILPLQQHPTNNESVGRVMSTSSSKGSQHSTNASNTISTSTSLGSSPSMYPFGSRQSPGPLTGFPRSNRTTALLQGNKIRSGSQRSLSSSSSSMMWEFFRPGLVRMPPDIELRSLKSRTPNNNSKEEQRKNVEKNKKEKKGIGFGLLSGCNCTADSMATNLMLLRSDSSRIRRKSNVGSREEEELRRKLMELIQIDDSRTGKPKKKEAETTAEKKHCDHGHEHSRRITSWSRTFEWVKELPGAADITCSDSI